MTQPGFSSRTVTDRIQQFPQRDEALMDQVEHATDFAEQPAEGFSNSDPAAHAPDDVAPDVNIEPLEPGFTNDKAVGGAETKVVSESEDKSVKKPARKRS